MDTLLVDSPARIKRLIRGHIRSAKHFMPPAKAEIASTSSIRTVGMVESLSKDRLNKRVWRPKRACTRVTEERKATAPLLKRRNAERSH